MCTIQTKFPYFRCGNCFATMSFYQKFKSIVYAEILNLLYDRFLYHNNLVRLHTACNFEIEHATLDKKNHGFSCLFHTIYFLLQDLCANILYFTWCRIHGRAYSDFCRFYGFLYIKLPFYSLHIKRCTKSRRYHMHWLQIAFCRSSGF